MPTNNSWNSQDPVQVTKGGTGLSTVAQGDLLIASASNTLASLPKDTNSTRYLSNTGTNNAPAYAQVNLSNGVTGTLPVGNGGLGITTTPTNGQIPIGNGTNYTAATLTAGSGISLTNAAGSVTIDNTRSAPAMVLLHTITFNNTAANYDITSYVTGYDIYKFFISNLPTVTANAIAGLQFSTNGGSTWITTGYVDWGQFFLPSGIQGASVTDMVRIGPFNGGSGYLAQSETMMSGYGGSNGAIVQTFNANVNNGVMVSNIESGVLLTASLNGIRLTNTTGTNFPSGKFSIYGITT